MRRSLGGGGGRGMGGGGGGGSGMVRTFQRSVKAGVGGAPPNTIGDAKTGITKRFNKKRPTSPTTALTLVSPSFSAPFSSTVNLPTPAATATAWISSSSSSTDELEWEYVNRNEDETAARDFHEDYVFGTAPSSDEVHHAVSALQQAVVNSPKANVGDCEMDWVEPSHNLYSSKALERPSPNTDVVYGAFRLLETEPSMQRMVVSLSSDKAVWDAVLNNEVVRELRGSIHRVASLVGEDGDDGDDDILGWVVMFAKTKVMQLPDLITKLVNNVFHIDKKGDDHGLNDRVKSSLFLSIMVLLVVILARTKTTTSA